MVYGHEVMMQRSRGDKMTAEEVSKDFFESKISPWTVRDLWRRGEIPGLKCAGRLIFSRTELERWFREQSRANMEKYTPGQHGKLRAVGK